MSGGTWDYIQYRFRDIEYDLIKLIEQNDSEELNDWGEMIGKHYAPETIEKLRATAKHVRETATMLERTDYLIAGDDSEEGFHERWDEDLGAPDEQKQ
ncbi:MAG: hypothetical protein LC687_01325 [Actinobacteria bacterium]|nr:hypothetical protein [Actinomycetota bacterium]